MKPNLISFDICPFVQRSAITLLEKKVEFDISYIDLANPPQWFLAISPLGKVPVLRVGDEAIFESAVINEYLDDITPPSMHPADPLQRAINKAWIEFASEMLGKQYRFTMAVDEDNYDLLLAEIKGALKQLEAKVSDGPFFNGEKFCLIDAAYAPFFTRAALLESYLNNDLYADTPKVARWADTLVGRDSVINSVKKDFSEKYLGYITTGKTYTASLFA